MARQTIIGIGLPVPVDQGGTASTTAADARTALGLVIGTNVQAYDADLQAIAGLTSAADTGIMFTGAGSAATYPLTAAALSILDDTSVGAMRTTLSAAASGANTDITSIYVNNTGLKIRDTDASHGLSLVPGSNLSADRALTITTGDADRTLTINGSTTLGGGTHSGTNTGDQSLFSTIVVATQSDVVADTSSDTLTLVAGSGMTITTNAGSDTITFASSSAGLTQSEVTGTSQAMSVANAYTANNAGLVTFTLPASAAFGTIMQVKGKGAGGWRIAQNASQVIHMNDNSSTSGVGGRLDSLHRYDCVTIECITANTDFIVTSASGVLDVI